MPGKSDIRVCAWAVLFGCISVAFNLQSLLKAIVGKSLEGHGDIQSLLNSVFDFPTQLVAAINPDPNQLLYWVMRGSGWGLWIFGGILLFLAMVHRDHKIPAYGIGGWLLGLGWITVATWTCSILWMIVKGILVILGWIGWLLGTVIVWLVWLLSFLSPVLIAVAVIGGGYLLWQWLGRRVILIPIVAAVLYLVAPWIKSALTFVWENALRPVVELLAVILKPVVKFTAIVLEWIIYFVIGLVAVVLALAVTIGALGSIGYFLMEQFKAAWECGWERKGILMGSFSLGSALAVLLLTAQGAPATLTGSGADVVTAAITAPAVRKSTQAKQVNVRGNKQNKKRQGKKMTVKMAPEPPPRRKETLAEAMDRGWSAGMLVGSGIPITRVFAGSLPTRVQAWAASTFSSATAPFFDGFVLFLVTLLSVASCALGVFRWDRSKSTVSFVRKDLLTLLGLPFAVVLAAVGAADVGSDGS